MDNDSAAQQVSRMRDFIIHEADEKAGEIDCKAEADYVVEKQKLTEDAKLVIKKDFERKEADVSTHAQIAAATETNKNKLLVLQSAAGEVETTFEAAYDALAEFAAGPGYAGLLVDLIKQAATLLDQKTAVVRCREQDKAAVESAISSAGVSIELTVSDDFLTKDASVPNIKQDILGGVLVTSTDGKIVVNQTLNSRLQVVYDNALPALKPMLFNQLGSKHVC